MLLKSFPRALTSLSNSRVTLPRCRAALTPALPASNLSMFRHVSRNFTTANASPPPITPPTPSINPTSTGTPGTPIPDSTIRPFFKDDGPSPVSLKIPIELRDAPFPNPAEIARKVKNPDFKGKLQMYLMDFETTGMSKRELPRILEVSAKYLGVGGKRDQIEVQKPFYSLSDPGIASSIYAFDYHRIMRSEVRGKPPIEDVMKNLVAWVNETSNPENDACVFLTTHFSKTEKLTLAAEFGRAGVSAPTNWTFVNSTNILDSVLTGTEKSQKIENIFHQLFGQFPEKAHRSEADIKTLFECINKVFTDDDHFRDTVLGEMAMGEPSKMI